MKKFFATIFLAMIFLISGQTVHAQDVYVGTSNTTGRDCYVMTETIYWPNVYECDVRLKMVRPSNSNVQYLDYHFELRHHIVVFTNSQGYSAYATPENYPIEWAMWIFITDYSQKYNIRYK